MAYYTKDYEIKHWIECLKRKACWVCKWFRIFVRLTIVATRNIPK